MSVVTLSPKLTSSEGGATVGTVRLTRTVALANRRLASAVSRPPLLIAACVTSAASTGAAIRSWPRMTTHVVARSRNNRRRNDDTFSEEIAVFIITQTL